MVGSLLRAVYSVSYREKEYELEAGHIPEGDHVLVLEVLPGTLCGWPWGIAARVLWMDRVVYTYLGASADSGWFVLV